jgi:Secretion system C-terminal sorting domain
MRHLYPTVRRFTFLILLVGNISFLSAQDLPGAGPSIQTAPAGTLVIAMDNTNQATSNINVASGTYFFNLKAYGLAVLFRNAGINIQWVINSTKTQDGIDFSATAERLYPSYVAAQSLDFRAGPFLIFPSDTLGADYLINWFNYSHPDSSKVKVYRLTQDVDVDIRYTLNTPPRVAIMHDSCDIHQNFMGMASVPTVNFECIANTSVGLISGCYTMVTMPHMDANDVQSYDDDSVYNFVMAGGNMLAACDAIQTFENITRYQSATGSISKGTGAQFNNNVYYDNPAMAYGQFQGTIRPRIRGALQVWRYTSSTINNFYSVVSCRRNAGDNLHYAATAAKLRSGLGGMAFYLGNHEFYTFECRTCLGTDIQNAQEINGIRMYLNAIMVPTEIIPCVILDVKLGDFTATKQRDETVLLKWNTFSETDNSYFLIEHSGDGKNFKGIGKRLSNGNTSTGHNYDFIHAAPINGMNFYRLKMVDLNGKAEYSAIRKVVFAKDNYTLSIFPNPAKGKATLMLDAKDNEQLHVRIFDGAGRMVKQQIVIVRNQQSELKLEGLQTGVYAVIAINNDGEQFKTKLMINQ